MMQMQNDMNFEHIVKYSKTKVYIFSVIAIVSLIAGIILIKSMAGIICLALSLSFIILMFVQINRLNKCGEFEKMDVLGNQIIYNTDKEGPKFIEPKDIHKLDIKVYREVGKDYFIYSKFHIKIWINGWQKSLWVNNNFSAYELLVKKLIQFKEDNFIV